MKNTAPFLAFNQNFFEKHQSRLLWLLNYKLTKRWFRWVLRIRKDDIGYDKPIEWILPNAYAVRGTKEQEFIADFRTHPKYGKRLYHAFKPLWWTMHFWDWVMADRFVPRWSFGFSTLTAYPDYPAVSTCDGYVYRSSDQTFANIQSGVGTAHSTSDNYIDNHLDGSATTNQFAQLYRGIILFDTSALTSGATISAATLTLYSTDSNKANGVGSPDLHICSTTPASNTALANGDYSQFGSTSFGNITYSSWTNGVGAANAITINASGIANISLTGITKWGSRLSWDINNNFTGTWANSSSYIKYAGASFAGSGTTDDPKLVVTYSNNVTTTKTQTGKARVQITSTQTQTGKARITATTTQTQTGKANVRATTTQTQSGKGDIRNTTTKTQTALSRIQKTVSQTITGLSRIVVTTLKTITGQSRIIATTTQTQTGKGDVRKSTSQTQVGLGRIQITDSQTQTGLSRIQQRVLKTITGVGNIFASTTRTQIAVARLQKTVTQVTTGLSRIQKSVTQTITGLARILVTTTQTITGKARVLVSVTKNQIGLSRITATAQRLQLGLARVQKSVTKTITGVVSLATTTTKTQTGKGRIQITNLQTISGIAFIRPHKDYQDKYTSRGTNFGDKYTTRNTIFRDKY
jgi:hypothetical protein